MNKYAAWTFLLLLFAAACGTSESKGLGEKPSAEQEKELLSAIIRYVGRMPAKARLDTKFEAEFDEHYARQSEQHRIDLYYRDKDSGHIYLLVNAPSRSLYEKRVGVGIHLQIASDSLVYYEEVFRTWKMPEAELAEKGTMLFTKMAKGQDLSPYYPQNSGEEEYIEFPDGEAYFDVESRTWQTTRVDPMAPYYKMKEDLLND